MSGSIKVFHYQGGSSDKIWAISTLVRADGKYNVWYGRRNATLTADTVPADEHSSKRIQKKLEKGYVEKTNMTVDMGTRQAVLKTGSNTPPPPEPEEDTAGAYWFTIGSKVDTTSVGDFLDEAIDNLRDLDEGIAAYLQGTEAYLEISSHERQGSVEFKEGPLALLLMFGLRRFIENEETLNNGGKVQLADDAGNMVPDDFDLLKPAFKASNAEFLAEDRGSTGFILMDDIKQYAIALGCIDAPLDLSAISTETRAAFF